MKNLTQEFVGNFMGYKNLSRMRIGKSVRPSMKSVRGWLNRATKLTNYFFNIFLGKIHSYEFATELTLYGHLRAVLPRPSISLARPPYHHCLQFLTPPSHLLELAHGR